MTAADITRAVTDLFHGITFTSEPKGLYDPLRYMISIGGKRIRPRLCLTAYGMYAGQFSPEVLECAAALGAKYIVLHPVWKDEDGKIIEDDNEFISRNVEEYGRWLDKARDC
ncbi:MAG: hypothetical protein J5533_06315, partial [Bacteroidales bacterium]|nr:hypothetical protein [Bacteroidales bacterium]